MKIKLNKIAYPGAAILFLATIAVSAFYSVRFFTSNISGAFVFSAGDDVGQVKKIDLKNLQIVADKIGVEIEPKIR